MTARGVRGRWWGRLWTARTPRGRAGRPGTQVRAPVPVTGGARRPTVAGLFSAQVGSPGGLPAAVPLPLRHPLHTPARVCVPGLPGETDALSLASTTLAAHDRQNRGHRHPISVVGLSPLGPTCPLASGMSSRISFPSHPHCTSSHVKYHVRAWGLGLDLNQFPGLKHHPREDTALLCPATPAPHSAAGSLMGTRASPKETRVPRVPRTTQISASFVARPGAAPEPGHGPQFTPASHPSTKPRQTLPPPLWTGPGAIWRVSRQRPRSHVHTVAGSHPSPAHTCPGLHGPPRTSPPSPPCCPTLATSLITPPTSGPLHLLGLCFPRRPPASPVTP